MVLITEIHQWQLPVEQHNSKGNQKNPKPISRNLERKKKKLVFTESDKNSSQFLVE